MTWRRSLWPRGHHRPAGLADQVAGDLAGEGAVGLGPAVLGADLDRVVAQLLGDRREARERREDRAVAVGRNVDPGHEPLGEPDGVPVSEVHLPVAGDEGSAHEMPVGGQAEGAYVLSAARVYQ